MLSTRLGWFGCLFIAGAMMLGAVLMLNARRDRLRRTERPVDSERPIRSYQHRLEKTDSILGSREYYVEAQ